jgi:phosphoenolpyruvate carboxykinase (GTP)
MNPENGYFGVAPGTSEKTNYNAMIALQADTIFTNVAVTDDGKVWWEGMDGPAPEKLTDWKGDQWTPASGTKAAHPNSRFTTPATRNPAIAPNWDDPKGVPLSAILFGGRRATTVPLVVKARDWEHGVYMGATMASETTAAATGAVGVVRRDPMAMLPFAGYNIADYLAHWLRMGERATTPPQVFQVNWFKRDADGNFIWPGFGENMRVLQWVRAQVRGEADGISLDTPLGQIPTPEGLGARDLGLTPAQIQELFKIDGEEWSREFEDQKVFLDTFGDRLPKQIRKQYEALKEQLSPVGVS